MGVDAQTNLDRHLRGSKRVDLTGVAWDRIADYPLSAAEARSLTYMMDIESHTMVFLRDLLATRAIQDAELTAFLACWVYEELWHGEAISRFLGQAEVRVAGDPELTRWDDPYPSRVARIGGVRAGLFDARHRLGQRGMAVASSLYRGFPAVHMAWGAINELSTLTAYEQLIRRTQHPVLADVLARLVRDERRHYSFYRVESERRLSADPTARRVTRFALSHFWSIVGTGVRPQAETDFVVLHLFGDEDGRAAARAMDATVDGLPGQAGLGLFGRARARALSRAGGAVPAARPAAPAAPCPTGTTDPGPAASTRTLEPAGSRR